jgi:hypothetical protein
LQIKHCCEDCGAVLAVHEHANYQQVKDCRATMRPLCDECRRFPGSPLPSEGTRGQDYPTLSNQSGVNNGK